MKHPSPRHFITVMMCALSTVALVGPGAEAKTKAKPKTKATSSAVALKGALPELKVIDLSSSKTVDLASFNSSTKPQLVWFWAPT